MTRTQDSLEVVKADWDAPRLSRRRGDCRGSGVTFQDVTTGSTHAEAGHWMPAIYYPWQLPLAVAGKTVLVFLGG